MLAEHTKQREDIEATFTDKITFATNRIEQLKGEKTELEKEMLKLKYWQPYKEDTETLKKKTTIWLYVRKN